MVSETTGGTLSAELIWDPTGHLFRTAYGGETTTRFLYDGDALVGEYSNTGPGTLLRRFVHGAGVDDPVAARACAAPPEPRSCSRYEGTSTADTNRRFLHADERGSIVAITNNANAVTNINSYDEWGIPAPGNVGRFQYTGQAWIPQLGMYHYKARIYSPTLGRFMQTDPIGYEDGMPNSKNRFQNRQSFASLALPIRSAMFFDIVDHLHRKRGSCVAPASPVSTVST